MTDPTPTKPVAFDPKPAATADEIHAVVAATPVAGAGGNLGKAHAKALIAHLKSHGLEITLMPVAPPVAKPKVALNKPTPGPFANVPPGAGHPFEPPHIPPRPVQP